MKLFVLVSLFSMAAAASLKSEFAEEWNLWKTVHSKSYDSDGEELQRHLVWMYNKKYIEEHNAKNVGFTLAMNQFGDLTSEEFVEMHSCYQRADNTSNARLFDFSSYGYLSLPDTVDWRTKNAVTEVKNEDIRGEGSRTYFEEQCGSCYAFSAVGALEGAHALAHDELISLSEQNVVDCSVPYGNNGCNGGSPYFVFQYVIDNQGIDTDDSYQYKGRQGQCHYDKNSIGATEAGVVIIPRGSEANLMAATATAGPVAVAVDGSSNAFRFYASGVYDEPNCSTSKLTNSMLVTGYGVHKEKEYWLVKNSWGKNWGMDGYIMMTRNQSNQCGIATDAIFPTL